MRQDEQKAQLIAKIREKLKTMSDQDVLRVLAAYEAGETGGKDNGQSKGNTKNNHVSRVTA